MNGPTHCTSLEMNAVVQNKRALPNISEGINRDYAQSIMGSHPTHAETLHMQNGAVYQADVYQVEPSQVCGGGGKHGGYDRVFYYNNVVVGTGDQFFKMKLAPYFSYAE
tara:strand:- start:3703 stop:4029 length:327 start_codon:yes stop_codon:yes gene_type:complete